MQGPSGVSVAPLGLPSNLFHPPRAGDPPGHLPWTPLGRPPPGSLCRFAAPGDLPAAPQQRGNTPECGDPPEAFAASRVSENNLTHHQCEGLQFPLITRPIGLHTTFRAVNSCRRAGPAPAKGNRHRRDCWETTTSRTKPHNSRPWMDRISAKRKGLRRTWRQTYSCARRLRPAGPPGSGEWA